MSEQQPQQEPWTRPPTPEQSEPEVEQGAPAAAPVPYLGPVYQMPAYQQPSPAYLQQQPPASPPQQVGAVAVDPRRRLRAIAISGWAAAAIAATVAVAVAVEDGQPTETSAVTQVPAGSSSAGTDTDAGSTGSSGSSATDPGSSYGALPDQGGWGGYGRGGFDGGSGSSSGASATSSAVAATAAQQTGVVTIDATLGYEGATSAGTGMILSADGLVLTNNHVVDGATAIQVTDESTGKQYTATVVGTDASSDVALLQLQDASGLTPVALDDDGGVADGDAVTAVGNAEGTGDLVAATGSVTDTDQTMTAQTETGAPSETLDGLIEFQAAVVSGDSGGPVLDAEGEVVGMTTAASSGSSTTIAYAITIEDALAVVHQIESGSTADGITIGYPAFLGVAFSSQSTSGFGGALGGFGSSGSSGSSTTSGATIAGVIAGSPAASAGLVAGDTITAVDGTPVTSSDDLSSALDAYKPGDSVTVTWVSGTTGASSSATVTLIAGPAD